MRCPHCRRQFRVEGRFCPHCGRQLFGLSQPDRELPAEPAARTLPPEPETYDFRPPGSDRRLRPGAARRPGVAPPPDAIDLGPAAAPQPAPRPPTAAVEEQAGQDLVGKMCPFDRYAIAEGDRVVVCPYCKVPHHADCWRENGGCTTRGCEGAPVGGGRPVNAGRAPAVATPPLAIPREAPAPPSAFPRPPGLPAGGPRPWQTVPDPYTEDLERNATNGVVLALIGLGCCPILSVVGLILGIMVLSSQSGERHPSTTARTRAIWAVVVGIVGPLVWMLILLSMRHAGAPEPDVMPPVTPMPPIPMPPGY